MAAPDSAAPEVALEAAVGADQRVEGTAVEDLAAPTVTPEASADADQRIEDATPEDGKHGDTEGNAVVTPEEMRSIIEVIADTGKFWHDWSFLKRLLSLHLKQVLAEYSDAQMVSREGGQQQNSLSGETYSELISQLNNAFLRFEEGPPFTLQRLCEILLDPKGTYTKLSKLALALEKSLLVTSTMTKCTDPYPGAHGPNSEGTAITENTGAFDVEPEMLPEHPAVVPNGTEHVEEVTVMKRWLTQKLRCLVAVMSRCRTNLIVFRMLTLMLTQVLQLLAKQLVKNHRIHKVELICNKS